MDDDNLATEISKTIPPEAALAARVAQLERHALAADSDRITGYHDERERNTAVDHHFTALEQRISNARMKTEAVIDLIRAALAIACVALAAALIALGIAVLR